MDESNGNINNNQSAQSVSVMKNGLKFYAASNGNSTSSDQARTIAKSLVSSNLINRISLSSLASNSSSRSRSPPQSTTNKISDSSNLQFVFDYYFQKEQLKDDNQYRCEHCRYVFMFGFSS